MWQRAKAIAREMKQERDLAAAAATETTGGKWDTASVVSLHSWMETNDRQRPPSVSLQSARGVKPASSKQTMDPEEPDRTPEPPAPGIGDAKEVLRAALQRSPADAANDITS